MGLKGIGSGNVDLIHLAQTRLQWRVGMDTAMNLRVSWTTERLWLLVRPLLHGFV